MKLKLIIALTVLNVASLFAYRVDTLFVQSKAMQKNIPNLVILPDAYEANNNTYSVVYLLHGAGDDYTGWSEKAPNLKQLADRYNLIFVCPDGGRTSWYFDSPIDVSMQYETYVAKELVNKIEQLYRAIPKKENRAIAGLSMGGHGALFLASKHPHIWGAAGSMSGGVDIRPFPNNWDIAKRLGTLDSHQQNWEENTVINKVEALKKANLKLMIDCGVDDFFYKVNMNLHQKLKEEGVPHDFILRPGSHNWGYWNNAVKYQMLFFSEFFKKL